MRKLRLRRAATVFFVVALATLFTLPSVLTLTNSFMSQPELSAHYGSVFSSLSDEGSFSSERASLQLIPDMFSLTQYENVLLRSPEYLYKFWNSVLLVLPIVAGQTVMAAMAAYSFYRCRGRLTQLLFFTYIILMLMPYQVMLVPNFLVARWTGLYGSYAAVILPGIFAPFSVFLLSKYMRRIPEALVEAARLDKASEWRIFTRVCLPQCRGALMSVAILAFLENWNMVEQAIVLLDDAEKRPLSVYLAAINAQEVGLAFAVASVYMVPPLLIFLYGEKYLVEGIAHSGSVKG